MAQGKRKEHFSVPRRNSESLALPSPEVDATTPLKKKNPRQIEAEFEHCSSSPTLSLHRLIIYSLTVQVRR